jgi:putative tricarboxylic transport membrane protein
MSSLEPLFKGFTLALDPLILLYGFIGCLAGTLVGLLPGIAPALTIALLLPFTFTVPATSMFVLFAGIYYGAMYGGSTSSILLNTPGESSTVVTALEGNKMAKKGLAGKALATAAWGSFFAGTVGLVALTLFAPLIVDVALKFGPAEYFSFMVLSCVAVSAVLGSSTVKGMISLSLGLIIGLIGIDIQSGQARFTFGGKVELLDGIEMVMAVVGLFALGDSMYLAYEGKIKNQKILKSPKTPWYKWMNKNDWKRSWKPWLRGSFLGFPIGALPAGGAEVPTLLSYYTEKKLSKHKNEFGKGAIEGVAGPEAANNSAVTGVLMPLLTLGIPTSATAAVLLSAFQSYGIVPGPSLLTQQGGLVWTLIASLYIGNVILLILNLPLVGIWIKILQLPASWLYTGIIVICTASVYSVSRSSFDLLILFFFGFIGFCFKKLNFSPTPLIIGIIIGPLAEQSLRQAMIISMGDWSTFVTRPISASILFLSIILFVLPFILKIKKRK